MRRAAAYTRDGVLHVEKLARAPGDPVTIDLFLRTLADAHQERAIGIILSGMGADGAAGLARIRENGGVTIVQSPGDAQEASMPQSAIAAGVADFILPAAEIAAKLLALRDVAHAIHQRPPALSAAPGIDAVGDGAAPDLVDKLLALLLARSGHDFRQYRRPTIMRRLERRLQVRGLTDLSRYYQLLENDLCEPGALLGELLIGVTSFFRDPEAFEALERTVIPQLFADKRPQDQVRAWVTACSTGQEAYTLGMLLTEHAARMAAPPAVQVFASDLDERAIAVARAGRYPVALAADLSPAQLTRLQEHFTLDDDHYRVRTALRERILFTPHNLLHDPAFSRLDLITCRNFLIYLNRDMHRHVLELFHCALNPGGYLFLGSAESADMLPQLFAPVDAMQRIYQAKPSALATRRLSLAASPRPDVAARRAAEEESAAPAAGARSASFSELHERKLVDMAAPSLLVDRFGEIVHVSDRVGRFLHYASGEPTRDLLALVLPDLRLELRSALFQARRSGTRSSAGPIRYQHNGLGGMAVLSVEPVNDERAGEALWLVQFDDAGGVPLAAAPQHGDSQHQHGQERLMRQLEEELQYLGADMRMAAERAALSSTDMRSANEELKSRLEEMRVAMEGAESGREELQSRNEELFTVNTELSMKAEETAKANDDLSNLIASTDIATLFLDRALRIKRFTPHVTGIFNVIPGDVGRPLAHITNTLDYPGLLDEVARVLASLQPTEREARSTDGRAYIVRIHPYRTFDERIEGAVLTFFDITSRRRAEEARRAVELQLGEQLAATELLQRLSTRLIPEQRPEALHEPILEAAMTLMRADAATIQLLQPGDTRLRLIATRNIAAQSEQHWCWVDAGHASTCARVLSTNGRVLVEDVETCPEMTGTRDLEEYRRSSIRAVQSTPLTTRSGRMVGMLSTHWRMPHRFGADDFRLFDVLARQLADLIERAQSEGHYTRLNSP